MLGGLTISRLLGWAKALRDLAARNPLLAVLIVSLALNWLMLERGNRYRDRLVAVAAAQAKAAQDQVTVNHFPVLQSKAIAEKSDAQAPAYYRSVAVSADAHRVRSAACPASPASVPGTDRAAAVDDGPAPAADMVSRPRAEDDLIVAAAGRAAQMHQDALDLIAAGVAVAQPEPAP